MAKSRKRSNGDASPEIHGGAEPDIQSAPQSAGDTTAAAHPDRERVAMRAYELYQSRGGSDGQALEDWLAAERELMEDETNRRDE